AAGAAAAASTRSKGTPALAPIGILSAEGTEQAPVLAAMHVTGSKVIDGYLFYIGTISGVPVVDAFSGEVDESAELAATLLISSFHPRAMLFSGTAGAEDASINVGDVVVSGMVVDKSNLHFQLGGYQTPYEGVEMHLGKGVSDAGDTTDGFEYTLPTPADAATYGNGPATPTNKHWVYITDFAAPLQLVKTAEHAPALGTNTVADATGTSAPGIIENKLIVGVIGQAPVWTEPLPWIEAEDFVYQSDAEENEGTGFAFACAAQGVPWMLVRGISDTPWHPNAYDGVKASDNAAKVAVYVVEHLPATISKQPTTFADLSPGTNARVAGYVIANQAWYSIGPVSKVTYVATNGKVKTLAGAPLRKLEKEYTYGASKIGPIG
ncbi:MAG TPA: 5'-methylthioadenosine/S-adenosylhomocysteine nucleosidase, partial [Acidimicrobiales bacterium]|nr:5'-methylthioadenosine/S-adenosylhomocysteine nucleosidase [Acidimicrobiales bacterium]